MTRHPRRPILLAVTVLAMIAALAVSPARLRLVTPANAAAGDIFLRVESARSVNTGAGFVHEHDAVTSYKWLITRDAVGDANDSKDRKSVV